MKRVIKATLVSVLALFAFTTIVGATDVKADYIHTFKQESLFAKGNLAKQVINPGADLYNFSDVKNRALAAGTDWYTDQVAIEVNSGNPKYRVATNEWVNYQDVAYVATRTDYSFMTNERKKIFSFNSKDYTFTNTGKILPIGNWSSNKSISLPTAGNGIFILYRQVATNEWTREIVQNGEILSDWSID